MPDEKRHESADLEDYEVLDSTDTLDGPPGDDPLDRGVVTPDRWSAGVRFGTTGEEQEEGESLDQHLAEEEPDVLADVEDEEVDDEPPGDIGPDEGGIGPDENATEEDVRRYSREDGADPRAGRWCPKMKSPTTPTTLLWPPVTIWSPTTPGSTPAARPRRRQRSTRWTTIPIRTPAIDGDDL